MPTRRPSVLVAVLLLGMLLPGVGHAVPGELTDRLSEAREQVADFDAQVSQAVEEHNVAAEELAQLEDRRLETEEWVAGLAATVAELEEATAGFVRSMYMRGPTTSLDAVLDTEALAEAGRNLATLDRLSRQRHVEVEQLALRRDELGAARRQLDDEVAQAQQRAEAVAQRRDEVEALLAEQRDEVDQLQEQIAELERQEAEEAARRARRAAERAQQAEQQEQAEPQPVEPQPVEPQPVEQAQSQQADATTSQPPSAPPPPEPAPAGTRSGADVAVDAALSQLGKPYRWAGEGPDSYDCSGLTLWAWRHAGVSLPHSSRMQYSTTTRISRSQLQPGDLVFFGSPIHHVAMYIGNGRVVEAPSAGKQVRVNSSALSRSDITGYGRV